MSDVSIIAKKEFEDIISSNVMLVIMLIYFVMIFCTVYYWHSQVTGTVVDSPGMFDLILDGSLVAIVLGISAMYDEVGNKALSTLTVKPLFRDSILNGKLIGALCFAVCLFVLGALVNISLYYMFVGSSCSNLLSTFIDQLSLVMLLFVLSFMMFYLLTMLAYLLLRDHSAALFIGFCSWMFLDNILPDASWDSYLGNVYSALFNVNVVYAQSQVSNFAQALSPGMICYNILYRLNCDNLSYAINNYGTMLLPLFLFAVILLVLCYIVFMRRDVA